jgi:hypothetical protein
MKGSRRSPNDDKQRLQQEKNVTNRVPLREEQEGISVSKAVIQAQAVPAPEQPSVRFAGLDPAVARCMMEGTASGRTIAVSSVRLLSPSVQWKTLLNLR